MWKSIVAMVKGWNPSLVFYKFLVYAMILVVAIGWSYREGVNNGEARKTAEDIAELKTEVIQQRTTLVRELEIREKRITQRLDTIGKDTVEAAKLKAELNEIKGDLNEAIRARAANAACAPSVQELRLYEELAKRTAPKS